MPKTAMLRFGPFRLDVVDERLWHGDDIRQLTAKSFAVLRHLVEHAGRLVTRDELFEAVWGTSYVSEAALASCIRDIRRALGEQGRTPQFLETVRGRGYRFLLPPVSRAQPSAVGAPQLLVGREAEQAQLHQWFATACQGARQMVFITGEAGMGKTTLADAFLAQVATAENLWIGSGQCIEHYGAGEAYLPVLEALGQLCRAPDGPHFMELLRQHAPSWLLQMPTLLSPAAYDALQQHGSGATRERMLRELAEAVETLTAERPLVLVLEDLHWSDGATLDWLAYVARRRVSARLLVLGTYRPVDARVRHHPVHAVTQELHLHDHCVELALTAWSEADIRRYLTQWGGGIAVPPDLVRVLHQRTRGNPLFLVTLLTDAVQRGVIQASARSWEAPLGLEALTTGVPASLHQVIEQHLAQLAPAEQAVLEAASVAGQDFAAATVAAGLNQAAETIEAQCAAWVRRGQWVREHGVVEWPDGTVTTRYGFLHDLYHETLYTRVSAGQRVRWHRQIGLRLEHAYGDQAQTLAAELAMHFLRGRDPRRAVSYLRSAGEQAMERQAHQEALTHLTTAIETLHALPQTAERDQEERTLLLALGEPLIMLQGPAAPEVLHTYTRVQALCPSTPEHPHRFAALSGLWRVVLSQPRFVTAQLLAEQCDRLAQALDDPVLRQEAQMMRGATALYRGELRQAHTHLAQGITLYRAHRRHPQRRQRGTDPGVACLARLAWSLWLLGYAERAHHEVQAALTLAQQLVSPFDVAFARHYATVLHLACGDLQAARFQAEATLTLCHDYGFTFFAATAQLLHDWIAAMQWPATTDLASLQRGLDTMRRTGSDLWIPYGLALLAATQQTPEQAATGLQLVTEAATLLAHTDERYYEAELHRLRGTLLRQQPGPDFSQAEACYGHALTVARSQQAKSLELRAAISLGQLWQEQGKRAAARQMLGEVYGWFTEGFATTDLREAEALLAVLCA